MANTIQAQRKLFAKRLEQLRKARGMSQEQVAELAGFHRNFIGRLERAQQNPSLDTILMLAAVLRVKPGKLLES